MPERLYFKMWHSWWTSESHEGLEEDPLAIGPVLMSFCRWNPGDDYGWAVTEKGNPVSCSALARRARWKGRTAGERVAAALRELERVGTAELRSDGAWGLPKFGRWQESADAARKRKVRGQSGKSVGQSGECPPNVPALVEGEGEEQHASHVGRPKSAKRARPDDPFTEATTTVLRALNDARASIASGLTPLRKRDHIRARLAEGATIEQLLAVIAFAADECRRDPAKLQWLDAVTPFRPKNWESRLARAQAWQATFSRHSQGQRFDATPDQLHRERQERLAAIAAEENA